MEAQDRDERYNKYEQYLRKKQTPEQSSRIVNRVEEIYDRYATQATKEETSVYELKARVEELERQLMAEKNTNLVKEEKIKQLSEELLGQPNKRREEMDVLRAALQKKETQHRELQEKYISL